MENIYLGLACFTFVLACGIFFLLVFIYFRINSLELKLKKVSRNFDDFVRENGCLFGTNNKELFLVKGATHIQTYWKPEFVKEISGKLTQFYNKNL